MIDKILETIPRQYFLILFFVSILGALLAFLFLLTTPNFESGSAFISAIIIVLTTLIGERASAKLQAKFRIPELPPTLVERKLELTKISSYLRNKEYSVKAAIVGMPGKGKTTLALQVVHRIKRSFPDGVFWLRVTELTITEILKEIIIYFGESSLANFEKEEIGATRARTILSTKKALIVLDDIPEKLVKEISYILELPCSILATSQYTELPLIPREGIFNPSNSFSKEAWVSLVSMRMAEARIERRYNSIEKSWISFIAYKLLLLQVKVGSFFKLESSLTKKPTIETIFQEVEGLPLALSIVASSLSSASASSLEKYLRDLRLAKLSVLSKYDNTPTLNVRATLQVAFERLSVTNRLLFALLSMRYGAGIPFAFVNALWDMSEIETKESLQNFVKRSLLETGVPGQWHLHSLIREFAKERLKTFEEEKREAGGRLSLYYAEWVVENTGQEWISWDREWPDLRSVINWAVFKGKDKATVKLALLTSPYLEYRKLWKTRYKWLKLGVLSARQLKAQNDLFELLYQLGSLCLQIGTYEEAKNYLSQSIELSNQYDLTPLPQLYSQLGQANTKLGFYEAAEKNYEEARIQHQIKGDWKGLALITALKSRLLILRRNYHEAYTLLRTQDLTELQRNLPRTPFLAFFYLQFGYAATKTGNYEVADLQYREALKDFELLDYIPGKARAIFRVGQMHLEKGNYGKAYQYYLKSLQLHRQVKVNPVVYGSAEVLEGMGDIAYQTQDYEKAVKFYERAQVRYELLGYRPGQLHIWFKLGKIAKSSEKYRDACILFWKVVQGYQAWSVEEPWFLAEAAYLAAFMSELLCDYSEATEGYQLAHKTYRDQLENKRGEIQTQTCLARLAILQGHYREANGRLEGAIRVSQNETLDPIERLPITAALGNLALTIRDFREAKAKYFLLLDHDSPSIDLLELQAQALNKLSFIAIFENDTGLALEHAEHAKDKYEALGNRKAMSIESNICLGRIALNEMRFDEASQKFRKAFEEAEEIGFCLQKIEALRGLAEALGNDFSSSLKLLEEALNLAERVGLISMQAIILSKIGEIEFLKNDLERAKEWSSKSLTIFEELELVRHQTENNLQLAEIALVNSGYNEVKKYWSRSIEIAYEEERNQVYASFRELLISYDDHEQAANYATEELKGNELQAELEILRSAMGEERYETWRRIYEQEHG